MSAGPSLADPSETAGQQAAQWWLRQRTGGLSPAERLEFMRWLRESPLHVRCYLETAAADRELREICATCDESAEDLRSSSAAEANVEQLAGRREIAAATAAGTPVRSRRPRRRLLVALCLATVLSCVVGVDWWLTRGAGERVFQTAHGEQGSFPLPDGSVLHLNSDSRAVMHFTHAQRLISVEKGQAMFKVAKDPARRFHVTAGDTHIFALGTQFDVYRRRGRTEVVVLEGRVAVVHGPVSSAPAKSLSLPRSVPLDAGQRTSAGSDGRMVVKPADLRQARAWLQREIVFDATPVREVVADFNRYSSIPIVVEGESLGELEISGVFGAYDLESFLQFISRVQGVRVKKEPGLIRLVEQPLIHRGPVIAQGKGPMS